MDGKLSQVQAAQRACVSEAAVSQWMKEARKQLEKDPNYLLPSGRDNQLKRRRIEKYGELNEKIVRLIDAHVAMCGITGIGTSFRTIKGLSIWDPSIARFSLANLSISTRGEVPRAVLGSGSREIPKLPRVAWLVSTVAQATPHC